MTEGAISETGSSDSSHGLFRYPHGFATLLNIAYVFSLFFPVAVSMLAILILPGPFDFWDLTLRYAHPLGLGWFWAILIILAVWAFLAHRPIRVSNERVAATMFGRPWRSFAWDEISRIEKRITFQYERGGLVETLVFRKGRQRIRIGSYIEKYDELKRLINDQVTVRSIEVVQTDKTGTKAKISSPGRV